MVERSAAHVAVMLVKGFGRREASRLDYHQTLLAISRIAETRNNVLVSSESRGAECKLGRPCSRRQIDDIGINVPVLNVSQTLDQSWHLGGLQPNHYRSDASASGRGGT